MKPLEYYQNINKGLIELKGDPKPSTFSSILVCFIHDYNNSLKGDTQPSTNERNLKIKCEYTLPKLIDPSLDIHEELKKLIIDIQDIVIEIIKDFGTLNMDFNLIFSDIINNNVFCCKYAVGKLIEYKTRFELFEKFINEYLSFSHGFDQTFSNLESIFIILRLPFSITTPRKNKEFFYFQIKCNHRGSCSERSSKGCQCQFNMVVKIFNNGKNTIFVEKEHCEVPSKNEKRNTRENHLSGPSVQFWNTPLTKNERNRISLYLEMGLEPVDIKKMHPEIELNSSQIKSLKQNTKFDVEKIDQSIKKETIIETVKYLQLVNKINNNEFHSFTHINKDVASKSYSKFVWFTDTTLNLNIYNKSVQLVCTTDENNFTQILSWGLIENETEEGFNYYFGQLKNYLKWEPRFIVVDRGLSQLNSLNNIFPNSKKCYCVIHIMRSIKKYFHDDLIKKIFQAHIYSQISIEQFKKYIETIFEENGITLIGDESFNPENESESVDDNKPDEEEIINSMNEVEKESDFNREKHKAQFIHPSEKELKEYKIKDGKKCLMSLYNQIEMWSPDILEPLGLYSYGNTNRVEGLFGIIKRMIHHEKLSIIKLIDTMNYIHSILMNRDNPLKLTNETILNIKDPQYNQLNNYCIDILNKQYKLLNKKRLLKREYHCRSCIVRVENTEFAWPCWHYMKKRQLRKEPFLVDYKDIPKRGLLPTEEKFDFLDNENILVRVERDIESNEQVKNGVLYVPKDHDNQQFQRTSVDRFRKRKNPPNEANGRDLEEEIEKEKNSLKRSKKSNNESLTKRKL